MSAGAARVVIGALLLFVPSMPAPAASKADISAIAECRRLRTMVKVAGENKPALCLPSCLSQDGPAAEPSVFASSRDR